MAVPNELSGEVISKLYETFVEVDGPLAPLFPPLPNDKEGVDIIYDVYKYGRQMARQVPRHSKAPNREGGTGKSVHYQGVTLKGKLNIPPQLLDARQWGNMESNTREVLIARAVKQLRRDNDVRLEWLRAQWLTGGALLSSTGSPVTNNLADGYVYLDYNANAASAPVAVTLGMHADNINATVASSWASSACTSIQTDLQHAREVIQRQTGVDSNLVIMNSNSMGYLRMNQFLRDTDEAKAQLFKFGSIREMWGFKFMEINSQWPADYDTMAGTAGTDAATLYFIPDNVVIVTSDDNAACGRDMLECSPSDMKAPRGMRGVYAWTDEEVEHPHEFAPGLEWSGGPITGVPNTVKLFKDITAA